MALVAVAWLNLVLQPCAMAMDPAGPACPHCPTAAAATGEHAAHQRLEAADSAAHCATTAVDCDRIDARYVDTRSGTVKVKDPGGDLPLAVLPAVAVADLRADRAPMVRLSRDGPSGRPPLLYLLYCIFLK